MSNLQMFYSDDNGMNWKGDSKISDADKKGRKTRKILFSWNWDFHGKVYDKKG